MSCEVPTYLYPLMALLVCVMAQIFALGRMYRAMFLKHEAAALGNETAAVQHGENLQGWMHVNRKLFIGVGAFSILTVVTVIRDL